MNGAYQLIERGNQQLQNGNYKEAIEDYTEAIRLSPNENSAYFNRGVIKFNLQDYFGAAEDFSEAIRINMYDADAYCKRGNSKKKLRDYQGAVEDYSIALRINPDYAEAYYNRGFSKDEIGDYNGAIEDYSQFLNFYPEQTNAYYNIGIIKKKIGDFRGAIESFSQAIRIQPDYAEAYNDRGISKDNLKDYKGAIEDYNEAIRLNPNDASAFSNRGISIDKLGDYRGAIENFSQALRLNPNLTNAYNSRAVSKSHLGDFKGAIQDYNLFIRFNPNDARAYHSRAVNKIYIQDFKGAIEDATYAISLQPYDNEAYNIRGFAKRQLQDLKGAQSDLLAALRFSQEPDPLHIFNLANLYLEMGLKNEALKRYTEGIYCFQRENEESLKDKFNHSQENINHIKQSIENFEKLKKQAEEIKQEALKQNRTDIVEKITRFDDQINSACIQSAEERANQNKTENQLKALRKQLDSLRRQLQIVNKKLDRLETKVEEMEKRIYTQERINNLIEKIDSKNISEFYKLLYNMLINHFMAYRMLSTGFFTENVREVTTFDKIAGNVCKAQSIIESLPILGDLVGVPFQILNFVREEKSSRLNSVIADKINGSRLQSEAIITLYISHLIEVLISNRPFNARLQKAIKDEQKGFLNKVMDVFGQLKEKIYSKVFGGSSDSFSYVQQAVTLYVTRFTLQLYEVDSGQFQQNCKNEENFTSFFMGCFEDKDKEQSKGTNKKNEKPVVNDSLKQPWITNNFEVEQQSEPQTCCQRFFRCICCCL